jgi:broad specificity phosphatase PhoE
MSAEPAQAASVSGLALLIEWANGQDHWIRKLVGDVIETRRRLSEEGVTALYELLLREKGLAEGDPVDVPALSAAAGGTPGGTTIRLVSLRHVENVNALAPNQEIEFHPRLTVCFGENASGKTGYVRILKRAAAVRTAEPVLPNIHTGTGGRPRARIKVLEGEAEHVIEWQGEPGVEPPTRIDVFDARTAAVHLAEDLSYSYTPADLSLFRLVVDGIERVQARLQAAREARQPRANPFVNRFPRESRLYAKIEGLGASTDLAELEALGQVSKAEETELFGLRHKVDALRSGSVRAQIERAEREHAVLNRVLEVARIVVGLDRDAYRNAVSAVGTARAAHERATREALSGEDVPGILGDAWKAFVEAAEGYIRDIGSDHYPAHGQPCVYCRQPLGDAAVALIRKYRDYCNAALRQAVEEAGERLRTLSAAVRDLRLDELKRDVESLVQGLEDPTRPPPALAVAQEVVEHARVVQAALVDEKNCPAMPPGLDGAPATLRTAVETAETTAADLRKQGEERARALAEEHARLRELEARLTLRDLMPAIRDHVEAARWADRAGSYLRPFQGIKKSLTETSKRASAEVLNRDFERRFSDECQALRAPRVKLDFPGREGEARRRKLLTPEHGLGEILSEGEQKVIALADFLAEASVKPDKSPIIMDDPVTSLDHKRLQHVVDRLVQLSRERQVIVFTHDIWFAAELLARFEHQPNECFFYDVTAEEGRIGAVAKGSHPRTDTFNDRKKRIQRLVDEAQKASGESRQALIEKGYEELRGACEVVVEKDILRGVTERYRPNVRMTVLDQIRAERLPAAAKAIQAVFEKCCRVIASHSQPLPTLGIRPSLDELKEDWASLQKAREEYLQ